MKASPFKQKNAADESRECRPRHFHAINFLDAFAFLNHFLVFFKMKVFKICQKSKNQLHRRPRPLSIVARLMNHLGVDIDAVVKELHGAFEVVAVF